MKQLNERKTIPVNHVQVAQSNPAFSLRGVGTNSGKISLSEINEFVTIPTSQVKKKKKKYGQARNSSSYNPV